MGGRGSGSGFGGGSGGGTGNRDYDVNGDYTKKIDIDKFKTDYGSLPALEGSEKQVAWAEKIRESNINALEKELMYNAESYNGMVDARKDALAKGQDLSGWGRITKKEYQNNIDYLKQNKDKAHETAVKSIAEFYRQNPKASTVIDTRQYIPAKSLVSAFRKNPDKISVETGVKYIIRNIAKEGYNPKELIKNFEASAKKK